jgi:hypothetical protein
MALQLRCLCYKVTFIDHVNTVNCEVTSSLLWLYVMKNFLIKRHPSISLFFFPFIDVTREKRAVLTFLINSNWYITKKLYIYAVKKLIIKRSFFYSTYEFEILNFIISNIFNKIKIGFIFNTFYYSLGYKKGNKGSIL